MSIRKVLIRLVADIIYVLRYPTVHKSTARFIVFTGTSGKTLARSSTTYTLRKYGFETISPPFGYTNELGVVLASLGVESVSLLSLSGIKKVLFSKPKDNAIVCVELCADWYQDITWFLKRYKPYGVCITNTDPNEWGRTFNELWNERKVLIEASQSNNGFICYSSKNENLDYLRSTISKQKAVHEFTVDLLQDNSCKWYGNTATRVFVTPFAQFLPYREAFGFAITCLFCIDKAALMQDTFFLDYTPTPERFFVTTVKSGAALVADTYKSIPQCARYVIGYSLTLPATKRIAVISEMHPVFLNEAFHYKNYAKLLLDFDEVYYVGSSRVFFILKSYIPKIINISFKVGDKDFAQTILRNTNNQSLIVIKGAGRYKLVNLVNQLTMDKK